jgi:drug/metabolite transporter (DMT)-like permease
MILLLYFLKNQLSLIGKRICFHTFEKILLMRKGYILLILAEFCFAGATVFAKFATTGTNIPAIEVTFLRFFLGFFITWFTMHQAGMTFTPVKFRLVVWRAILNTAAVILFFLAVKYTTITNANMLNMTYPVYLLLFAPLFLGEKVKPVHYVFLVLTMIGIWLIIHPDFHNLNIGDFYGIASGIVGSLAIVSLRKAREFDSTYIILFYLMLIGMIINGVMLIPVFVIPTKTQLILMCASALLGYAGQAFITSGYKHVEAGKGSMVSSSRILFAFLFGAIIFSEPITWVLLLGAGLITISLIGVTRKSEARS